ncbi:MAG: tetratricopeptide repeat protein [Bacteroidia bacterium]
MRFTILFLLLCFPILELAAQKEEVLSLVREGISLHDQGKYDEALVKYEEALKLEENDYTALSEIAITQFMKGDYEGAIATCQKVLRLYPEKKTLANVYVTYGSALDLLGRPDEAIKAYSQGMEKFPDVYLLPFNKGITEFRQKEFEACMESFERAITINPDHASSHRTLAIAAAIRDMRIPAILASLRFLALEPQSTRSAESLEMLMDLMGGNVKKSGRKEITISLNTMTVSSDSTVKVPNDFSSVEIGMYLIEALDQTKEFKKIGKKLGEGGRFSRKLEMLISFLDEQQKDNTGFFWEHYVPYLADMKKAGHAEAYSMMIFSSNNASDKKTKKWVEKNPLAISKFLHWNKTYSWSH